MPEVPRDNGTRVLGAESRCAILPNERSYLESEYGPYLYFQSISKPVYRRHTGIQGHVQGRVMRGPSEGAISNRSSNDLRKTGLSA